MTDNPNKKSLWDKIHLDPTMLLILLALLTYSALVIWSASGQDVGMMERKIGQIAMGVVIMIVMAQIPPRVYEGWAPYLYIFCIILLVAVDAFGAISKGAQRWLDLGIVRFQPSVSYTHLRAHETRHDLVCRLLLEKKKTKRRTPISYAVFFL